MHNTNADDNFGYIILFPILTLQAVTESHRIGCWGCWTRSFKDDITTGQLNACPKMYFLLDNILALPDRIVKSLFFRMFPRMQAVFVFSVFSTDIFYNFIIYVERQKFCALGIEVYEIGGV